MARHSDGRANVRASHNISVKKSVARVPTYQQGFEMNQFGWYHAEVWSLTIASAAERNP